MDANRFAISADIAYKFHIINTPADPARSYTKDFVASHYCFNVGIQTE